MYEHHYGYGHSYNSDIELLFTIFVVILNHDYLTIHYMSFKIDRLVHLSTVLVAIILEWHWPFVQCHKQHIGIGLISLYPFNMLGKIYSLICILDFWFWVINISHQASKILFCKISWFHTQLDNEIIKQMSHVTPGHVTYDYISTE